MSKKRSDTWMAFYVGDYLRATTRLTPEQHGAYLLLILDQWVNGPQPDDDTVLAQIARMSPAAWKKAKPALIGFFDIRDGSLVQKRVEKERLRAAEITDKRSEAGKEGAAKRWQTGKQSDGKPIANAMANGQQTTSQNDAQPQPPPIIDRSASTPLRASDCFNEVCQAADWRPANDTQRQNGISIVDGWLALGCSLDLILEAIAQARRRDNSPTRSLKRFDSTIRGKRADQLGGELPVTQRDVQAVTRGLGNRMAVGGS